MTTILVFSGSNSSTSINQQLAIYAASYLDKHEIHVIHLKDYPAPVYSMDMEKRGEFPETMRELNELFKEVDAMLISLPEHNGSMTSVFKNMLDWISRIENPTFKNKPVCLLSTSPGQRGASNNLNHVAEVLMPWWGGVVTSTFSLPNFDDHLVNGMLKLDEEEERQLVAVMEKLISYL